MTHDHSPNASVTDGRRSGGAVARPRRRPRRLLRVRSASLLAALTILLTGGFTLAPHGTTDAHAAINHCNATEPYHAHRNRAGLVNQHHYFEYMTRRYVGSYLQVVYVWWESGAGLNGCYCYRSYTCS